MQQELGITFLYVTHDQEEALTMSDTVVVMNHGQIQQIGTPMDIYNEPKNAFVADFIGESNIIDGSMPEDWKVTFLGHTFDCEYKDFPAGGPVDVVVRPEDVYLVDEAHGNIKGTVESVIFKGVHYEMKIDCGEFTFLVQVTSMKPAGSRVGLIVRPEDIHVMAKGAPE
jgi:spermidine/putrescine transport system ATP-binding protein